MKTKMGLYRTLGYTCWTTLAVLFVLLLLHYPFHFSFWMGFAPCGLVYFGVVFLKHAEDIEAILDGRATSASDHPGKPSQPPAPHASIR